MHLVYANEFSSILRLYICLCHIFSNSYAAKYRDKPLKCSYPFKYWTTRLGLPQKGIYFFKWSTLDSQEIFDADKKELSIIIPCLNEVETLGICIEKAKKFLKKKEISGEILVSDNGSIDGSIELCQKKKVRIVHVEKRGYGEALKKGIKYASGKFIIMGDADDSYDFLDLDDFIAKLRGGYDLVMGNRFKGGILKGAMPPLHYYLGNPVLSFIGRLFFNSKIGDFHCGLRGFKKKSISSLNLISSGMEFASEMIVKASLHKLNICEVPVKLYPDKRSRMPHLNTWRDGWRHLTLLLLLSPKWLFFYPGLFFLICGILLFTTTVFRPLVLWNITLDIHCLLFGTVFISLGVQLCLYSYLAFIYSVHKGFRSKTELQKKTVKQFRNFFSLNRGILIGILLFITGCLLTFMSFFHWGSLEFGNLSPIKVMRWVIPAGMALLVGTQLALFSFIIYLIDREDQ